MPVHAGAWLARSKLRYFAIFVIRKVLKEALFKNVFVGFGAEREYTAKVLSFHHNTGTRGMGFGHWIIL